MNSKYMYCRNTRLDLLNLVEYNVSNTQVSTVISIYILSIVGKSKYIVFILIYGNPYINPIFKLYQVQKDLFGAKIDHLRLTQIHDLN